MMTAVPSLPMPASPGGAQPGAPPAVTGDIFALVMPTPAAPRPPVSAAAPIDAALPAALPVDGDVSPLLGLLSASRAASASPPAPPAAGPVPAWPGPAVIVSDAGLDGAAEDGPSPLAEPAQAEAGPNDDAPPAVAPVPTAPVAPAEQAMAAMLAPVLVPAVPTPKAGLPAVAVPPAVADGGRALPIASSRLSRPIDGLTAASAGVPLTRSDMPVVPVAGRMALSDMAAEPEQAIAPADRAADASPTAVEPAVHPPMAAAPGPAPAARTLDLSQRRWIHDLAGEVADMIGREGQARIALSPERLGAITIELTDTVKGLSLRMEVVTPAAEEALKGAEARLIADVRAAGGRIADSQIVLAPDPGTGPGTDHTASWSGGQQGGQRPAPAEPPAGRSATRPADPDDRGTAPDPAARYA